MESGSSIQTEEQHLDDVKSSYLVLHRWSDKSWGPGFDVIVFPKCVVALDPITPTSSKVIVFPSNHDTKFRVFYTAKLRPEELSPARSTPSPSHEFVSELRICVRDTSAGVPVEDLFRANTCTDIVLRWVDTSDKCAPCCNCPLNLFEQSVSFALCRGTSSHTLLNSPHYAFNKILYVALGIRSQLALFCPQIIKCQEVNSFAFSGKRMTSLFQPGSQVFRRWSNSLADAASTFANPVDPSIFSDAAQEEECDELRERPQRVASAAGEFAAASATVAFEKSVFESRRSCLRQVMKCIVSSELAKDPTQVLEVIHRQQSHLVLDIVQVLCSNVAA
jgi:hypothetical protein